MGGMKKPKKPKKVKMPKPAIKEKPSKEEKKIRKEVKKEQKNINKKLDRSLGACAILLCAASAILDVIARNRQNNADNDKG